MRSTTIILFAMLIIFSSCKKKDAPTNPCENGFLDIGELGIDCGGNCTPCVNNVPSYMAFECNGVPLVMQTKELTYNNGIWSLAANNDTFSIQLNLGSNGQVDVYNTNPMGSLAINNGIYYLNANNGTHAFYYHDTINKKMGGFFQIDFSRDGFDDTLRIQNGQFENLFYN
jgi:hypothetical protein